jgi:pimeloyl-ACP methyl ester carboxylesterase
MASITTKDGTHIYYKDWGAGQPIVFSHGWPLTGDDWDAQMLFFGQRGYRVIAHDRRGHGRSSQTWDGRHQHGADQQRPADVLPGNGCQGVVLRAFRAAKNAPRNGGMAA